MAPDSGSTPDLSFVRELPLTKAAIEYAQSRHGDQRRAADGAPFLVHLLEVASLLERSGYPDHVVAAAVLHDVLEDTDTDTAELRSRFGAEVCDLVAVVSDDPAIADEEARKDEVLERVRRSGGYAPAVFAADKVSKVRELRILIARGLALEESRVKLRRYRKALEMLDEAMPQTRLVEILRFELEALETLPPEPPEPPEPREG
jgi:(p)ppGpp synthase/HD superfamily hydrolase